MPSTKKSAPKQHSTTQQHSSKTKKVLKSLFPPSNNLIVSPPSTHGHIPPATLTHFNTNEFGEIFISIKLSVGIYARCVLGARFFWKPTLAFCYSLLVGRARVCVWMSVCCSCLNNKRRTIKTKRTTWRAYGVRDGLAAVAGATWSTQKHTQRQRHANEEQINAVRRGGSCVQNEYIIIGSWGG